MLNKLDIIYNTQPYVKYFQLRFLIFKTAVWNIKLLVWSGVMIFFILSTIKDMVVTSISTKFSMGLVVAFLLSSQLGIRVDRVCGKFLETRFWYLKKKLINFRRNATTT